MRTRVFLAAATLLAFRNCNTFETLLLLTPRTRMGVDGSISPLRTVGVGIWILLLATHTGLSQCSVLTQAAAAGSYHRPDYFSEDEYSAGHWDSGESRNYFIFNVPNFTAPLVSAELRVFAGTVSETTASVPFELHKVEALPPFVVTHSPYNAIFDDLGDGPVLGRRDILKAEGRRVYYSDPGALVQIPLNLAGLDELRAKQGGQIVFGGIVPAPPTNMGVFGYNVLAVQPPQLVLYFSNAGPTEVTAAPPSVSREVLANERANLAVTVCGKAPLTRQWLKNGSTVPNATNEVLEIRAMTEMDAGTYEMVASNEFGIEGTQVAALSFAPLRIFGASFETSVPDGAPLLLTVNFESRLPATVQWRKNGVNIPGQNQTQLWISSVTINDSGQYDAVVSNDAGSRTRPAITVTVVLRPPSFGGSESDAATKAVGASLIIYKVASGSEPLSYQWYRDGQEVPGANSNILQIASIGFNDAGSYRLLAANGAGSATSAVFQVTVEPLLIHNDFDQTALWLNPFTFYTFVESFFPVTAQWYFNGEPLPGATNTTLSYDEVDFSHGGPYFVIASNPYGAKTSAVFTLTVTEQEPNVYVGPAFLMVWVGEDVTFYGNALGGPPPELQWHFNQEPIPGATNINLVLKSVTTNRTGLYTLQASNLAGTLISDPASLTVLTEAPFFLQVPGNSNVLAGEFVTLRAKAIAGPPPRYQWRRNGADLAGETNHTLSLGVVDVADDGMYEIVAYNELGEARHQHPLRVMPPTGLDKWIWRLPQAQGSRLYNVAFGEGRYVAAGKAGNIITSTDSVHWVSITVPLGDLRPVAFGNGVFVTAGNYYGPLVLTNWHKFPDGEYYRYTLSDYISAVLVSSNGLDWEFSDSPSSENFQTIVFGNGMFVAIGSFGPYFCYTSVDGRHWTGHEFSGRRMFDIAFGNGRFLAYSANEGVSAVFISTNGQDWALAANNFVLIEFADGRFFGSGGEGLAESVDGIDWVLIPGESLQPLPDQFAGAGGVLVGNGSTTYPAAGYVTYSTDARQWTAIDTGTRQYIEFVTFVNGQFLAVGEAGTITRSADGRTWTSDEVANKVDFYGITSGLGLRVAAGDAGTILSSSNGVDWVRQATPTTRNLHTVAYSDGLFVAGGREGTLISSTDGIHWNLRTSGHDSYIERVGHGGGMWVAVAERGSITISSNGVNWTAVNTGQPSTDHEGVAYGNSVWVAVGGYFLNAQTESRAVGTIYSSSDGLAWTLRATNSLGKRWRDVTFGSGKFVAVGNDGSMSFSTNGISWAPAGVIANENLRRVHYANGRFVAVGNNGTLVSSTDPADRLPWATHRSYTSQNLHDIHAGTDGTFVYVGNNGMVLQSGDTRPRFLSIDRSGRLEFDAGIGGGLRLERSSDLREWQTEALNVTSPHNANVGSEPAFWRLSGD